MSDASLLRFLELVQRELGAVDARIEVGGRDPEEPRVIFRMTPTDARVVAILAEPPADRSRVEARLEALIATFFGLAEHGMDSIPPSRTPPDVAGKRLDDELTRLAERAGAVGGLVFDLASPVVWGASHGTAAHFEALIESTIAKVRASQAELRPGHSTRVAVAGTVECVARPFAGLYVVALVFDGSLSELQALGALLHAMPMIEKLVISLPPLDPNPGGGKVMRLPPRLR